jgi:hypothetical protein
MSLALGGSVGGVSQPERNSSAATARGAPTPIESKTLPSIFVDLVAVRFEI